MIYIVIELPLSFIEWFKPNCSVECTPEYHWEEIFLDTWTQSKSEKHMHQWTLGRWEWTIWVIIHEWDIVCFLFFWSCIFQSQSFVSNKSAINRIRLWVWQHVKSKVIALLVPELLSVHLWYNSLKYVNSKVIYFPQFHHHLIYQWCHSYSSWWSWVQGWIWRACHLQTQNKKSICSFWLSAAATLSFCKFEWVSLCK